MSKLKISGQEGRALALTLIVLAVGCLLIPPFLAYISTNLRATRVTEEDLEKQYASDAGLEYGIARIMDDTCPTEPFNTPTLVNMMPITVSAKVVEGPTVHLGGSETIVHGGGLVLQPIGGRRGFVYVFDVITGTIEVTWMPEEDGCPSSHDDPGWILALYEDAPIRETTGITPTEGCFPNRMNPLEDWSFYPITSTLSTDCPFTLTISTAGTPGIHSLLFYNGIDSCSDNINNSLVSADGSWLSYITTGIVTSTVHVITSTAETTLMTSCIELFVASGNDVEIIDDGITRTFGITPTVDIMTWETD